MQLKGKKMSISTKSKITCISSKAKLPSEQTTIKSSFYSTSSKPASSAKTAKVLESSNTALNAGEKGKRDLEKYAHPVTEMPLNSPTRPVPYAVVLELASLYQ